MHNIVNIASTTPAVIGAAKVLSTERLLGVGNQIEFLEPDNRLAVTWRAIIAARRQRTARTDLWSVGDATALVLAEREKSMEENAQIVLDLANRILIAVLRRDSR